MNDEFWGEDGPPNDYETCGDCGFDHEYEPNEARAWHTENPGSYDSPGERTKEPRR